MSTRIGRLASLFCAPLLLALVAGLPPAARAGAAPLHPWISSPMRVPQPKTYFTNLDDGARIETPFVLRFGLSRFGLAPIGKAVAGTGHHHLLVNRDLPMEFTKPLPFNDQYIHFGKGQMETVLNFAPGTYTLRLLLADDKHIPHFIYSKPITVTVTKKNEGVDPKSLIKPGVAILTPASGQTVTTPFRIGFHASGLNVGHTDVKDAGVGHFRLVAEPGSGATERIDFTNGATEAWLAPPPGDYRFRLEFVRNAAPGDVMATSEPVQAHVQK